MTTSSSTASRPSDLLMLSGVTAACADCGDETVFVPVDDLTVPGQFCCTSCDAAVFLLAVGDPALRRDASRVA
jgi:hypothetical protein